MLDGVKALRFAPTPLARGAFGGRDPVCARPAFSYYGASPQIRSATDLTQQPVYQIGSTPVQREFSASRPNQLWVADLTYVATWTGFVYAAVRADSVVHRQLGSCWSCHEAIVVMKAAEDWAGDHAAERAAVGERGTIGTRRPTLPDSLMRPSIVEERAVLVEHTLQM